jgi:hypothetical protein
MSVNSYTELDVSKNGSADQRLAAMCETEAKSAAVGPIKLTSEADLDAGGPNLTETMRRWLAGDIEAKRRLAWSELAMAARGIRVRDVEGIVLEIEEDRIDAKKHKDIARIIDDFNGRYAQKIADVTRLKYEYEEQRQLENNRDVKMPSLWLEWIILLALMIPESYLNYSAFVRAWYIKTGFVALAITILVGVALAWAAFLLGLFALRARYYLHPTDRDKRFRGIWLLIGGTALLTFGLGAVAVARYYVVLTMITDAVMSGTSPPSVAVSVGTLLFGNLIGFLMGAAVTFLMNDPNERYWEKAKSWKKIERELNAAREKEVLRPVKNLEEAAELDRVKMKSRNNQMETSLEFPQFRSRVAQVVAKDDQIRALLGDYKASLAEAILTANPKFTFVKHSPRLDRGVSEQRVSLAEFRQLELRLWRVS